MKTIFIGLLFAIAAESVVIGLAGLVWGAVLLCAMIGLVLGFMAILAGSSGNNKDMRKKAWFSAAAFVVTIAIALYQFL